MPRKFFILWELPQILLALILYAIMKKRIIQAMDYKDSKVFFVKDFPGGISLSFMIFLNDIDLNNLKAIKHEYGHTVQSLYLGWFYLFIVGVPSIIRASIWNHYKLEDKKYYEDFPENWADLLGGVNKIECFMTEDNFKLDRYLNREIKTLFKDVLKTIIKEPSLAKFFIQTYRWQKRAGNLRLSWEKKGVHVPPFMIFSITNRCNLSCKGCYAQAFKRNSSSELSPEKFEEIINEAHELGISIILIAGGEPLVRKELLTITGKYPDIIFPVFTNGLLIDEEMIKILEKQKNVIPVLSIEGNEEETDSRRGCGVYEHIKKIIEKLKSRSVFWGISMTLTSKNFEVITEETFIKEVMGLGCRLFFYIGYIPVKEGTEEFILNPEQESKVQSIINIFKSKFPAIFIAFPGGEEEMGGCLSSGRGFVHVSPEGNLEPCPFAPYSDTSLQNLALKDALKSEFLSKIRENHNKLSESKGGCALWENRQWVQSLLNVKNL